MIRLTPQPYQCRVEGCAGGWLCGEHFDDAPTSANDAAAQPLTLDTLDAYRTELQRDAREAYARLARQCDGGPWAEHEPSIRDAPAIVGWSVSYRVRPGSWFIVRDRPGSSIGWLFVSAFDAGRAQAAHPDIAPAEPPAWAARVMALA